MDEIASILLRKRRVRRVENGYIDAKFEAIDDPDESLDKENMPNVIDRSLERDSCDLEEAIRALDRLLVLGDKVAMDRDRAIDMAKLLMVMCTMSTGKVVRPTLLDEHPCSGAHVREYAEKCSKLLGEDLETTIIRARRTASDILKGRQSREEARLRRRRAREREAFMPEPHQVEAINRWDAALDRSLARKLAELELVQRMESGENVPAPLRIQVDDHRPAAN